MQTDFLGRGWAFPPAFFAQGGEVVMVSGEEDIRQSLNILLSTSMHERILHSDFGCELSRYLFEEIDQSLLNDLRSTISDAILKHEGRVQVDEIEIQDQASETGLLLISITYTIRTTNNRYNLVFPFYLNEASI
jgi:hypothetical protein